MRESVMLKKRGGGREERASEVEGMGRWEGGERVKLVKESESEERYAGKERRVERRAELSQPLFQGQRLGQPRRVRSPVEEHEAKEEVLF